VKSRRLQVFRNSHGVVVYAARRSAFNSWNRAAEPGSSSRGKRVPREGQIHQYRSELGAPLMRVEVVIERILSRMPLPITHQCLLSMNQIR
jgi:hypothetical protein